MRQKGKGKWYVQAMEEQGSLRKDKGNWCITVCEQSKIGGVIKARAITKARKAMED